MGRMDAAARAFEAALQRHSGHEGSRIGLVTALLSIASPERSSGLVRDLLRDVPENPRAQLLAARHVRVLGDAATALRYSGRAIELDPEFVEAIVTRAQLLFAVGQADKALVEATRAVERDPRNLPALALLAQLHAALGESHRSRATPDRRREVAAQSDRLRELIEQIAQRPDDPAPRWKLGQVAAPAEARGLASESYRAALALDARRRPALDGLRALQPDSPPTVAH